MTVATAEEVRQPPADGAAAALLVTGASKRFGNTQALDNVDLRVLPGTVVALVGANGSGKSTLIKALAGYHVLDAGAVSVHGQELSLGALGKGARDAGLRFVHQDLALVPIMSVADNLGIARGYHMDRTGTIRWGRERKRTRAELEAVGLDVDPDRPIRELGPVERTLVAVTRALDHVDPTRNLLLLDEPTARLPQHEAARLIRQLKSLRDRGLPVVYVTHRLEEIYGLADAITVLRDGREVFAGATDSLPIAELRHQITGVRAVRRETTDAPPPSTGEPVLELRSVSARNIQDVTFAIRPGEVVGVTGLIGSGRSELGRVIYGMQRYSAGEIRFDGRAAHAPVSDARTAGTVAYTPQERRAGLLSRLSVEENATIASFDGLSGWYGLSRGRVRKAAQQVIDALKVKPPDPAKMIDLLSGGNQQKVVLGKWLRLPLRLVILDEPTQSIDIGAKADLMGEMRERARRDGLGVLWLESDVEELVKYADRILVMQAGRVIDEFNERPFAAAEVVAACYGGRLPEVQ